MIFGMKSYSRSVVCLLGGGRPIPQAASALKSPGSALRARICMQRIADECEQRLVPWSSPHFVSQARRGTTVNEDAAGFFPVSVVTFFM
jgi:hypothetical protein